MNEHPAPARRMTRNQFRAIVYKIAVTYLEVERGLRPPEQLAAFLTPDEYRRHRVTTRGNPAAPRPVRPPDIARVRIDSSTQQGVNASVLVRGEGDTWSALLVDLKAAGRGWQVDKLDRLERLLPREPREVDVSENTLARRIRVVDHERRAVAAAHDVASRRYDRVEDKRTKEAHALLQERDRWARRLEDLGAEAETLAERQSSPHEVEANRGSDPTPHHRDGSEINGILGPQPDDPSLQRIWADASDAIQGYRDRWELASEETVLARARTSHQAADRRQLLKRLRDVTRRLGTSPTVAPKDLSVETERSPTTVDL